ncbi:MULTISPECIES: hypothetical protein [Streptomyces]|uniref:Uncharacterized protein n=1 Tax=Streptomyces poriferorum TaxID=2798799 RepID=A0ABY9IS54_9ACTN|nr:MULTISPECIES: hypothetical protein [unclassified Streptomyces]MDP5313384.1 hypothetical protein [Streptomyces sp. Alt4]WLQ57634.1 hypothetical protein P8A19_20315 [Streptomyces sp. Alt2]WRZ05195.1 hypothetical protein OG959_18535 [Streptomyces sp. NBC_00385]
MVSFGWRGQRKGIPKDTALLAEAAENPGGSVAEIDPAYIDDPNGYVPPEAIRGAWLVDSSGKLTGEYQENPRHGAPQDDFSKLTEPDHWLGWLGDSPAAAVRKGIEESLRAQVADAVVEWIKILETPRFLTAARQPSENDQVVLVTRAALAAPFALSVRTAQHGRSVLLGVFTWAAVNLSPPGIRKDRHWFDLGVHLDWAGEQLQGRIYEIDGENRPTEQ